MCVCNPVQNKPSNITAVRKEKVKKSHFCHCAKQSRDEKKKIAAVDPLWVVTPPCSGRLVTWAAVGGVRAAISLFLCLGWCVIASRGD